MAQDYDLPPQLVSSRVEVCGAFREAADARDKLTLDMTVQAAIMEISSPHFPQYAELPRMASLPFIGAGHVVLLNYELLCDILWSTALKLKDVAFEARHRTKQRTIVVSLLTCLLGIIAAFFGVGALFFIVAGGCFAAVAVYAVSSDCTNDMKACRKVIVDQLVEVGPQSLYPNFLGSRKRLQWGTGAIGKQEVPVVIAQGNRKFPGYGREQISQLFVCPPKDKVAPPLTNERELAEQVTLRAGSAIKRSGVSNVYSGPLVVLGSMIAVDSPWLDEEKRPLLWISNQELTTVETRDPSVSARVYTAIQVLFPKYLTAATFFLRTFKSGSSASVEVVLCTLGPVVYDSSVVAERSVRLGERSNREPTAKSKADDTRLTSILRRYSRYPEFPRGSTEQWEELEKLDPDPPGERERLQVEAYEIQRLRPFWIGNWAGLPNWRESRSRAFTDDFFGEVEARAAVRALYEILSSEVLVQLDSMGFDVRSYRDNDGKLTIQADKIDRIVVGETVLMHEQNNETKGKQVSTTQTVGQSQPTTGSHA